MARKSRYSEPETLCTKRSSRMLANVYLRLSVEDGDDIEHNSIGNQKKICMDFLNGREDMELGQVFIDNGYTGMNYKRPDFQRMMDDLTAHENRCVIVKDISRLGRNYILTSELVERTFPEMGVRLICVNDQFDSFEPNVDKDSLLMPFKLIMNDTYVKDISRKIRSSIHTKMDCGEYLPSSSSIPYGYLREPESNTFSIDGETAPVVRRIFQMRAESMPFNAIARKLNEEQIPSPGKLRFDRGVTKAEKYRDTLWVRGTIRKITGDVTYLGDRVHGKVGKDRVGADKKKRPREQWQVISGAHPAIVERALFEKVQEVNRVELERRGAFASRETPETDYRSYFRDKVFCAECGAKMRAGKGIARTSSAKNNHIFYNCGRYVDSNHQKCSNHHIRQEIVMDTLQATLSAMIRCATDAGDLLDLSLSKEKARVGSMKMDAVRLQNEYNSVKAKLDRLFDDYAAGMIDGEAYLRLKASYTEELGNKELQRDLAWQEYEKSAQKADAQDNRRDILRRYQSVTAIDRDLIDLMVEKICVTKEREVQITFAFQNPFDNTHIYNRRQDQCRVGESYAI